MTLDLAGTVDLAGLPAAAQDPAAVTARLRRRTVARARRPVTAAALALAAPALWLTLSPTGAPPDDPSGAGTEPARLVAPSGRTIVTVVPAEPAAAEAVRPGDRVDVYALRTWESAPGAEAELVARRAEVVTTPAGSAALGVAGLDSSPSAPAVLLAVTPAEARALAGAADALISIALWPHA